MKLQYIPKKLIFSIVFLIFILFFQSCSLFFKHPVLKNLDLKDKTIKLENNSLDFYFNGTELKELKVFTKKDFLKYKLNLSLIREGNLKHSISIFTYYHDDKNYYRLNIFLDTGKIHFYKKENGQMKNLLYTSINPYFLVKENNDFELIINKSSFELIINKKIYFKEKINFKKGKVGFSAYGKKGEKAKIIFKSSKR